ncbi:MAG: glycogen synthase GlgA [Planctomycetota bacterium]|jgi:starch synthase|nr:glycogen synthase GlgA [Planctomycetota bacterium]
MVSSLDICLVASEVAPFAKTGGLADVTAALTRYLVKAGHRARCVMPYYRRVAEAHPADLVDDMDDIPFQVGDRELRFGVRSGSVLSPSEGSDAAVWGAEVWFIDCPELYDREGIYCEDGDEHLRFGLLPRAAIAACQWAQWGPDIFHCNDWHAALLPLWLEAMYAWDELFSTTRTVLTIHNIGYQGTYPASVVEELGLGDVRKHLHQQDLTEGRVNFLKTGLMYANALTTVSATYAEEIRTQEYGMGLSETLEARKAVLSGIVNGVDYDEWSPEKDTLIPAHYSRDDLAGKDACRAALLERLALAPEPSGPVLGIVSRMTAQKGFDLLQDSLPVLLQREDVRLCVLGAGDVRYERYFQWLHERFPRQAAFQGGYDNELAHWIEAGADVFLMPSRYEPCGLNQMYSLRYGTPPVVRRTGGLADTVEDWKPDGQSGTGFVFDDFDAHALVGALERVLDTWRAPDAWAKLVQNAMAVDWSWDQQVERYVELYKRLVPATLE